MALSLALSPLWVGTYAWNNFDANIWGWKMGVFVSVTFPLGLMILRYAPGGEGTMATFLAVSTQLWIFVSKRLNVFSNLIFYSYTLGSNRSIWIRYCSNMD